MYLLILAFLEKMFPDCRNSKALSLNHYSTEMCLEFGCVSAFCACVHVCWGFNSGPLY